MKMYPMNRTESTIFSIPNGQNSYTYTFTETYSEAPSVSVYDEVSLTLDINNTRAIITYPHTNGVTDIEACVCVIPKDKNI